MKLIYYRLRAVLFSLFPTRNNRILFSTFYGKSFSCNPKYIYLAMVTKCPSYDCVWVYNGKHVPEELKNCKIVRHGSLAYKYYYYTSRVLIFNTGGDWRLGKRKRCVYIQTWHGAGALKKIGLDVISDMAKHIPDWLMDAKNWDALLSTCDSVRSLYAAAFGIEQNRVLALGLPRMDLLFDPARMGRVRDRLVARNQKNWKNRKIILYAPTFRDDESNFELRMDLSKLKATLNEDFVLILRLHPIVGRAIRWNPDWDGFVFDFSEYEDIQELLVIADVLITDYSSLIYDFSVLQRPVIFFAYDLDFYETKTRGFYLNYRTDLPGPIVYTDDQLLEALKNLHHVQEVYADRMAAFARENDDHFDGGAATRVIEFIEKSLRQM